MESLTLEQIRENRVLYAYNQKYRTDNTNFKQSDEFLQDRFGRIFKFAYSISPLVKIFWFGDWAWDQSKDYIALWRIKSLKNIKSV